MHALGRALGSLLASGRSAPPRLVCKETPFNLEVLSRCPSVRATYKVKRWLLNGHMETIFAAKLRKSPGLRYARELLSMADGGTVALDFEPLEMDQGLAQDAPVLLLLPGLAGGSCDAYVEHCVVAARQAGIRAVVFNGRGTAGSPVTTPQFYSASFTGDLRDVVARVRQRFPDSTLFAAGWSLGANILVRYLGEEGERTPLTAAISLCNPFDLVLCDANLQRGFARVYDRNLAASLRTIYAKHAHLFQGLGGEWAPKQAATCTSVRQFDEAITRVCFGWPSADAYYAGSSSARSVPDVRIPLLCVQAADDPIALEAAIPYAALEANERCMLLVTPAGGHLGWVSGPGGAFGPPWSDLIIIEFLQSVLQQQQIGSSNGSTGQAAGAGALASAR